MTPIAITLVVSRFGKVDGSFSAYGDSDRFVLLCADVAQDSGVGFASELCVIWSDSSLATIKAIDLSCDEMIGAVEQIESAFWQTEAEQCRLARVGQQRGEAAA